MVAELEKREEDMGMLRVFRELVGKDHTMEDKASEVGGDGTLDEILVRAV